MKLKSETILSIYTHENKTILCQIKVPPQQQSREWKNTCRFLTSHQWNTFDRELEHLIDIQNKNNDKWDEDKFSQFNVKPNIEVKVQKSKLSTTNFYNCLKSDKVADDDVDVSGDEVANHSDVDQIKEIILECLLDYKEQTPSNLLQGKLLEYEPQLKTSPDGKLYSPSSYEPYTPTKKKYRINSLDTIKTPGTDFLGYESTEETYSPRPLTLRSISETSACTTIPEYKPAPITEKRSSTDSVISNHRETINDVVYETDDEQQVSTQNYRALRNRKTKKSKEIEYIPKSQENVEAPAYVPTPIEYIKHNKKEKEKNLPAKEDTKKDKENRGYDKNLKVTGEKPSASLACTKPHQTSKTSQKDTKERVAKKLDYKEKYKTRSDEKNEEIAKSVLLKPTTPTSSDDDLDLFSIETKTKSHKENDDGEFEQELKTKKQSSQKNEIDLNITISSATESITDSSPPKKRTKEIRKKLSHHDTAKLRRSGRSPSKPLRLIDEATKVAIEKKSNPQKISPLHKELFGTDYEDDDFEKNTEGDNNNNAATAVVTNNTKAVLFNTPKNDNRQKHCSSSSSSSAKKKRKRDKSSDCEQEKRIMGTWLSKKKSNSDIGSSTTTLKSNPKYSKSSKSASSKTTNKIKSSKDNKNIRSKSESPKREDFVMPTKEELEKIRLTTKLQHENNEKIKAELEKIIVPPPKEVQNLSLKEMSVSDLLATFDHHKHILDDIYQRNRKKDHIKSHDGINHCFVIRLMEPQTQLKMLEKLTDVYSSSNSTTQATLYANAMLPEWIIRVYMEKYSFNRKEAMQQIKAQDDYQLHLDEQNESAFMFD